MAKNNVQYEWRTSRGNAAISFNNEKTAREWKAKQLEKWKDKVVKTQLYRITTEIKVEQLI